MLWNKYRVCHYRETDPSKFYDSRFKAWRVGYSRHSFTTWFSSLPEYRLDWILKATLLFPTTDRLNGTYLNWTESQRLPRIIFLQRFFSQSDFSTNSNSQVHLQWLFSSLQRFSLCILSHRTALISRDRLVYLLTSLIELLISSQPESAQWLKTNRKQELDCNVKPP